MRIIVSAGALFLGVLTVQPVLAQEAQLNHLDCRFNETTRSIDCPPILTGRASTEVETAASVPASSPAKGSAEWNAQCAAKYKSFDPATGNYKSYSGKMRPCE